jgi:GNAT superfamily N-acetyltransferase
MGKDIEIRFASPADIELLVELRAEVIKAVFGEEAAAAQKISPERSRAYYQESLAVGSNLAALAYLDGQLVACGNLLYSEEFPSPDNPSGKVGLVENVYTRPAFRGRGIGRRLMESLLARAKADGIGRIVLESTISAAPFYASLGFEDMLGGMQLLF